MLGTTVKDFLDLIIWGGGLQTLWDKATWKDMGNQEAFDFWLLTLNLLGKSNYPVAEHISSDL